MDIRKKNTYEVLDMIEKNLISESDVIYYIENDYLDNQLLEDVMDTMFGESTIKELGSKINDLESDIKSHQQILKSLPASDRASYMKYNVVPTIKEKYKAHKELEAKTGEIEAAKRDVEAEEHGYMMGYGSHDDVEEAKKKLKAITDKHNGTEPVKAEAPKQEVAPKAAEKQAEVHKAEAPKQQGTGDTEPQKPAGGEDHANGIWEKIKTGYQSVKKAAGEHLETAKKYAMEHPGIVGGAAVGAAVAGLGAYAAYKHLKNKKAISNTHSEAHKAAMDNISKTHGHLSNEASAHIHNDIHNVINSNKDMFKKDPKKSKEQLINHFGSDEYKKHLVSKLSK